MNKKSSLVLAVVAALSSSLACAEESPWLIRFRVADLSPDTSSSAEVLPADVIDVSDKTIPDININYFFTDSVSLELVLTVPQEHDVTVGDTKIGTFKHLPPTLSLGYHFNTGGDFRPYVRAGVNYTLLMDEDMDVGGAPVTLENDSIGFAYGAGFDWKLGSNWVLNADVKKIAIATDVFLAGTKVAELDVDPLLVGVGLGYRF